MGFGDKFKDFTQQAKEKVAENRGKIQEAVDAASVVANEKTHGKYANKIMKVNEKTGSALDKFGADATGADGAEGAAAADSAAGGDGGAAGGDAASAQAAQYSAPTGEPPSFADDAPSTATSEPSSGASTQPGASWASGDGPTFDD